MSQLTKEQAAPLYQQVQPILRFLRRCRLRLDERGFDQRSPFFIAVDKAYCAVHGLSVELHYASVAKGVGKTPSEDRES
jgi:hypothetical protein